MKLGNITVYGVIYKITNMVNGKVYIGQTHQKNGFKSRYGLNGIESVYKYHISESKGNRRYNKHIVESIKKHGFNSFKIDEIIDVAFSKTELDIKEKCWISIYDAYKNGYNNTLGGMDSELTDEIKEKIKLSHLGNKIDYIIQLDKEMNVINKYKSYREAGNMLGIGREQIRDTVNGNQKTCHEFVFMRESKYKSMYINNKKLFKELYESNYSNLTKKVICLNTEKVFNSITEAEIEYGLNIGKSGIGDCCRGIAKSCGSFNNKRLKWMFYDEYINNKEKTEYILSQKVGNVVKCKKIICVNTGEIFNSIKEAGKFYSLDTSAISKVCKGKLNNTKGYIFKYYNDFKNFV